MFSWVREFIQAKPQTKYFVLNWALYGIAIIVSTVYCYARLDYVRSYKTTPPAKQTSETQKK